MIYKKEISIDAFLAPTADKKAAAAEIICATLDEDNMKFLADLCLEKGKGLNKSLRANANVIKENL